MVVIVNVMSTLCVSSVTRTSQPVLWHAQNFSLSLSLSLSSIGTYEIMQGIVYCKVHFTQLSKIVWGKPKLSKKNEA